MSPDHPLPPTLSLTLPNGRLVAVPLALRVRLELASNVAFGLSAACRRAVHGVPPPATAAYPVPSLPLEMARAWFLEAQGEQARLFALIDATCAEVGA